MDTPRQKLNNLPQVLERLVPAAMSELWEMLQIGPASELPAEGEAAAGGGAGAARAAAGWDLVFRGKEVRCAPPPLVLIGHAASFTPY